MSPSSARIGAMIAVSDHDALIFLLELYRYAVDLGRGAPRSESRSRGRVALSGTRHFILKEEGEAVTRPLEAAGRAPHSYPGGTSDSDCTLHDGTGAQCTLPAPRWDCHRQELRLGGHVIKQFKIPSVDQEIVLAAFEEENWPSRIDDPFCGQRERNASRRLQLSINALNRNQKRPLMRFLLDSSGQGIRWERQNALP